MTDRSGGEENFPRRTYHMSGRLLKITGYGKPHLLVDSGTLKEIATVDNGLWTIRELNGNRTYLLEKICENFFSRQGSPTVPLYLALDSINYMERVMIVHSLKHVLVDEPKTETLKL